jgi:hypothetical protein
MDFDNTVNTANAPDAYAGARATLRDIVKWLVTVFSTLAAVVSAGIPFAAGLGRLPVGSRAWGIAAGALFVAFCCICVALKIAVDVLRPDALYASDLSAIRTKANKCRSKAERREIIALRRSINVHTDDVLPLKYPRLGKLMKVYRMELQRWRNAYQGAPSLSDSAEEAQGDPLEVLNEAVRQVLMYGTYVLLYARFRRAMRLWFALGMTALVCLFVFGTILGQSSDQVDGPKAFPATSTLWHTSVYRVSEYVGGPVSTGRRDSES